MIYLKKILKRFVVSLITFFGVITVVFLALRIAPGDPALNILGEYAEKSQVENFKKALHLDEPLQRQYLFFLKDIFSGTFGYSFQYFGEKKSVSSMILKVLPATFELALWGILFAILIAFPLGFVSALKKDTFLDNVSMFIAISGIAIPIIWLGPVLIYLFTIKHQWLPVPGEEISDFRHLILPGFVLGTALSGKLARILRASLISSMQKSFYFMAKLRGLKKIYLYTRYLLRTSLIPVLTVLSLQFASLLSGAIITEKIFARPGIGSLLLEGISVRDYSLVQGCVIFISLFYIIINIVVDILYTILDPRQLKGDA